MHNGDGSYRGLSEWGGGALKLNLKRLVECVFQVTARDLWSHMDLPGNFTTMTVSLEGGGQSKTYQLKAV
jgi:hypothetical protein